MRDKPTANEIHGAHEDERNRVRQLERHEITVRNRERERLLGHLAAPLNDDETGFCPGGKI